MSLFATELGLSLSPDKPVFLKWFLGAHVTLPRTRPFAMRQFHHSLSTYENFESFLTCCKNDVKKTSPRENDTRKITVKSNKFSSRSPLLLNKFPRNQIGIY